MARGVTVAATNDVNTIGVMTAAVEVGGVGGVGPGSSAAAPDPADPAAPVGPALGPKVEGFALPPHAAVFMIATLSSVVQVTKRLVKFIAYTVAQRLSVLPIRPHSSERTR